MTLTHKEKLDAANIAFITFVAGKNAKGEQTYCYVGVLGNKMQEFMAASQKNRFAPSDFGTIIKSGIGEPTDDVKEYMTREFGFNHDTKVKIAS